MSAFNHRSAAARFGRDSGNTRLEADNRSTSLSDIAFWSTRTEPSQCNRKWIVVLLTNSIPQLIHILLGNANRLSYSVNMLPIDCKPEKNSDRRLAYSLVETNA